jgi:hypothetical protein
MSEASAAQIASKYQSVADQIADGCLKFQPVLIDMLGPTFPPIALFSLWCSTATSWLCFLVNSGNLSPEDMPIVRSLVAERFVIDCLAGFGSIGKDEIERGKHSFVQGCQTVAPIIVEWMDGTDNSKEAAIEILELPYFGEHLDKKQKLMTSIVLASALISVKQEVVMGLLGSSSDERQTETRLNKSTGSSSNDPSPPTGPILKLAKTQKNLRAKRKKQVKANQDLSVTLKAEIQSTTGHSSQIFSSDDPVSKDAISATDLSEEKTHQNKRNFISAKDVMHQWSLAVEIYPDIEECRSNLNVLSEKLAENFVEGILRTKRFEQADHLFKDHGKKFLESEFGENKAIVVLAVELLELGKIEIATKLKETLSVIGTPTNADSFIEQFCTQNAVTRTPESHLVQVLGLGQTWPKRKDWKPYSTDKTEEQVALNQDHSKNKQYKFERTDLIRRKIQPRQPGWADKNTKQKNRPAGFLLLYMLPVIILLSIYTLAIMY